MVDIGKSLLKLARAVFEGLTPASRHVPTDQLGSWWKRSSPKHTSIGPWTVDQRLGSKQTNSTSFPSGSWT